MRRAAWTQALSLLGTSAFYAAYALMAVQAALGRLTLGTLTLYIVSLRQGQQTFQSLLSGIGTQTVAVTVMRPSGRRHGSSRHLILMLPSW